MKTHKSNSNRIPFLQALALAGSIFCASGAAAVAAQGADADSAPKLGVRSLDDRNRSIIYSGKGWTPFENLGPNHSYGPTLNKLVNMRNV
jgi:hypothetical protein